MVVDVESALVHTGREGGVEALRKTLGDDELVRDGGELRVALESLGQSRTSVQYDTATKKQRKGRERRRTLRSLARKVIKSAHSLTWSKLCRVFSTDEEYLRYLGSACRAV